MGAEQKPSKSAVQDLGFRVCVLSPSGARASQLAAELTQALGGCLEIPIEAQAAGSRDWKTGTQGYALFIDSSSFHGPSGLDSALGAVNPQLDGVYLIVNEDDPVPPSWVDGKVDDVLVYPFRSLEVLSKLRHYQTLLDSRETFVLADSYARLLERFEGDLELARKLQKSKLPIRFPHVRGFDVNSRYLAGERPGGDYIDLAEARDGQQISLLLTDASSYRLSSAVLEAVTSVLSGLTIQESRSCVTTARLFRDGILASLSDKDQVSMFYGSLGRKDLCLRYVNLGAGHAFYAPAAKPFYELAHHGSPIVRAQSVRTEKEDEVILEPQGRLALISDGFVGALGGAQAVLGVLNRFRGAEAKDSINELVFRVKAILSNPDDLPAQDCTVAVFDVDAKLLRLA